VYRRLASITLGIALAMGTVGIAASPASAATVQSCKTVKGTITLSPGLGIGAAKQNQKVTIKGAESGCTPSAKTGGSGSFLAQFTLKAANCSTLINGGATFTGPGKTTWKNGKTTSYTITYKDGSGSTLLNITMTGRSTAGLFSGKKFAGGLKIDANSVNSNACTSAPFKSAKWTQLKAWSLS
jgi:hypothetical protein